MQKFTAFLSLSTLVLASAATSFAERSGPMVTIDIKNYETLLADTGAIMTAAGQDASMAQIQMQGMLGAELLGLIDHSEPWHAAVWMDSLEQSPVFSVALPIADFEAFEVAVQTSMIGMLGAKYWEVGDRVVLYGGTPGEVVPDLLGARIVAYVSGLERAPVDTIEIGFELDDEIRAAAVAGLALPKAQMMAAFEEPGADAAGMPPETMKGIMEGYFTFYETMLMDTDRVNLGINISDGDLSFSSEITPVSGSGFADFVASQNIDLTDLAASADWSSDMAMVVGMGDLPEAWQPLIDSSMKSLMPLYGLGDEAAAEWAETMQATLPFKGVYNMNFKDGMTFTAFYEILDSPSAEVYEKWLTITEEAALGEDAAMSYYSGVKIEKAFRTLNGHPVDRIEMVMNPEHPSMQMPEQQAMMDQLFEGGKVVYEMTLVGDRIYMATEGELEGAFKSKGADSAPVEINANTRLVGTMDFASIFRMGASFAGEPASAAFDNMGAKDSQITYSIEANESLVFKSALPLGIIEAFSGLE